MRFARRILPPPPRIAVGEVGTGILGLVSSWLLLGGGTTLVSSSIGALLTIDEGACTGFSDRSCLAANIGGGIAGVAAVLAAVLFSLVIARGFGPPAFWWALPIVAAGGAWTVGIAALAGSRAVEPGPIALMLGLAALAVAGILLVLSRGTAARTGWVRFDGLDAREVRLRDWERILFPALAIAAASIGGAFALHVARLLVADGA